MKTKILTLFLALTIGAGPLLADKVQIGDLYYNLIDSTQTAEVTSGDSEEWYNGDRYNGDITIPSSVEYNAVVYNVTSIGHGAFNECSGLTSITIPNSVTNICTGAFADCIGLTSVTIGNSVANIGGYAFYNCTGLTNIEVDSDNPIYDSRDNCNAIIEKNSNALIFGCKSTIIPNGVTSIGDHAFYGCSGLTSIEIPNSVISIGYNAFSGCTGLISITIGNSVTSIGISKCTNLTKVIINSNTIAGKTYTSSSNIKTIFGNQVEEYILGDSVTHIGDYAFYGCSGLTSITIPNSVTSIGEKAFYNCTGLTSIEIPNSVTSIGNIAFYGCSGLTSVYINDLAAWCTISFLDGSSNPLYHANHLYFNDTEITELLIPNSVTSIGDYAFYNCTGLTSIEIPNSVMSIGNYAFSGCTGITSITIPNSIASIGNSAFWSCTNLTRVIINSNTIVGKTYTYNSNFKTIFGNQVEEYILGDSVTHIGDYAFYDCSGLTSIEIPNSVMSIGNYAFSGCTGLTSVDIPNSVTSIGIGAFSLVSNIVYTGTANGSPWGARSINGYVEGLLVYRDVSKTNLLACSSAITGSIEIPNSVTSIEEAFYGCTGLTSITIPNSVTSIGNYAFWKCTGLTSIEIPNSVTSIGNYAFAGCTGLTSVHISDLAAWCTISFFNASSNPLCYAKHLYFNDTEITDLLIPNSVTSIGDYAFDGCSSLTSIEIPNSVMSIGNYAFYNCTGLTSIEIPNSVMSIGNYAFSGCTGITSITIPNSIASTGNYAFADCIGLTSVEIPNSVTSIGIQCFHGCSGLTSVTIGNGVTSIGIGAFWGCSGLTSIEIPNSVTSIGNYAFRDCSNLSVLTLHCSEPPILGTNSLPDNSNLSIYVPCGSLETYKNAWRNYASKIKYRYSEYSIDCKVNKEEAGQVILQNICRPSNLEAIPNYGYHFVQWSDGNTDNPRTIELTQDTSLIAEFAIDTTGVCGNDNLLTWNYDSLSHTLSISGKGQLNSNYTFGIQAPMQTDKLIVEEGVTSIGNKAFVGLCPTITSLSLPSTVTTIGDSAFAGLNSRKFNTLVLPNTIISIGAHAFEGASYLQTIHFGSVLEEIGELAFNGCTRVKQMTCLAEITPNVGTNGLTSISSLAELYIPNEYLLEYQIDNNWNRFVLKPIGATETTTTGNTVTVVADDNTATFTWPTDDNAASYTIQITKDGEVFCTLIFNGNGQLTGIAFAPGRNDSHQAPSATMANNAAQFTVTGLNSASKYGYRLAVTSESNEEIVAYRGEFATTGYIGEVNPGGEPEYNPEGIDEIESSFAPQKVMIDGQVFILRGDKIYTITGIEMK